MECLIEVWVYSLEMHTADKLAEASPPPLLQDHFVFPSFCGYTSKLNVTKSGFGGCSTTSLCAGQVDPYLLLLESLIKVEMVFPPLHISLSLIHSRT